MSPKKLDGVQCVFQNPRNIEKLYVNYGLLGNFRIPVGKTKVDFEKLWADS